MCSDIIGISDNFAYISCYPCFRFIIHKTQKHSFIVFNIFCFLRYISFRIDPLFQFIIEYPAISYHQSPCHCSKCRILQIVFKLICKEIFIIGQKVISSFSIHGIKTICCSLLYVGNIEQLIKAIQHIHFILC